MKQEREGKERILMCLLLFLLQEATLISEEVGWVKLCSSLELYLNMACSWTQRLYTFPRYDCYRGHCACWPKHTVGHFAVLSTPVKSQCQLLTELLPWSLTMPLVTRPMNQCGRGSEYSSTWSCSSTSLPCTGDTTLCYRLQWSNCTTSFPINGNWAPPS